MPSARLFNSWLKFVPPSNVDLNFEEFLLWYSRHAVEAVGHEFALAFYSRATRLP